MTLYEMLSFHPPFSSEKCHPKRNDLVRNKNRPMLHDKQKRSPILFQDLMVKCWSHEPNQRPDMSEVKLFAERYEFELLRAAYNLGNTTKSISCACVSHTSPNSVTLTSQGAIGGTIHNTVRESNEHEEIRDREPLHSWQSDPIRSVIEGGAGNGDSSKEEVHFSSNEPLNEPSTQIWIFEHVVEQTEYLSKAVIYTYQDGLTGFYRRSAVSYKYHRVLIV